MLSLSRRFVWPILAALAITGGTYFGAAEFSHPAFAQAAQSAKPTPEPQANTVAPASDLARAFRAVHDSMKDAVVNINVVKRPGTSDQQLSIPEEFRGMLPPGLEDQLRGQMQRQQIQGTGSGVIVSADGYILTNNHVVNGADDITVALNDGRELKADLVGTDPKTDLAVVRIKADHLTFAKFGNSDQLDVGDWVLAFGSPFGFSQTMTQGIISAKGRHVPIIAEHDPSLRGMTYENFLQTDAAINPGNSGGPLVNLRGEVVGINAAIASSTGAYNGIGFSIPSNDAQYIMKSLIEHGKVVRGYLGIGIEDINHPLPEHKGLVDALRKAGFSADRGVLVGSVNPGSPAAKAGVEPGDVITGINGKTVTTVDDLRNEIARMSPESKVNVSVYREGKNTQLAAVVGTQPDAIGANADQSQPRVARNRTTSTDQQLGVRVEDVDPATARRAGVDKGALLAAVTPNSLAAQIGLQPGDVVTRVDKTPITSAQQFADAIKSADLTNGVKLLVRSDGTDKVVYVEKKLTSEK